MATSYYETSIKTINLTKKFGSLVALNNLNLEIKKGEIFGLLGPNGAGKTTTIKILSGLIKPTKGYAFINGINVTENPIEVKKIIGLLPDHPFVYPKLTGFEFLSFICEVYKVDSDTKKKYLFELIENFDLKHQINERIETYSLGMRQKLLIISILIHKPDVLLLDEPLVGLDPKIAKNVKQIFNGLASEGKTILISTHILEIAEKISTKIGIINHGELTDTGTIDELRKKTHSSATLEEIFFQLTSEV